MCAFEINKNDKSKYPSKENIFKLFFNKQIKRCIKTEFRVQCNRFNTYIFFETNNLFLFSKYNSVWRVRLIW